MTDFQIVGKSYPRHESMQKVMGEAVYTGDIHIPGMVYGAILRSPYPHAKVLSIDKSEAEKVDGVLGILLPEDVPQMPFNCSGNPPSVLLIKDEKILTDHPLHVGDRIAAVVAATPEACEEALNKLAVQYKVLPAVFTIKEALAENTYTIHPELVEDNIIKKMEAKKGNIEEGIARADYVFEEKFYTPAVQHVAMEPTTCICHFTAAGKLMIWSTSQTPFQERRILSELLNMQENDIRIIKPVMGGGFGARQQLHNQHVGALLSKLVNKPVKIVNTREEEMYTTAVRHESVIHLKIGVTANGKIQAFHAKVYFNTGPYTSHGPTVMAAASRKLQYCVENYLYEGYCVLTNAPVAGAMRGYGNPQVTFAREVLLNRIAKKLNIDPVELRLLNHIQVGDKFPAATSPILSCEIKDCVRGAEEIKQIIDKKEKTDRKQKNKNLVEAWGVAFGCHTSGPSSKEGMSSCVILANDDGTVNLMTGSADIGQGSETALSQVVAEELGIHMKDVTIVAADTGKTPYDTGTFASSQMYVSGNAVHRAAVDLVNNLKLALEKKYQVDPHQISWQRGRYSICTEQDQKILSFKDSVRDVSFGVKGIVLIGSASFKAQESPPPFAVCWAKVAVDLSTYTAEVKHIIEAVDVGTAVNPEVVTGQVEGGIGMGFGYAMMEQIEINGRANKPISSDLLHYKLPLSTDMPQTHVYIAKGYEPTGPLGAKSVGELATVPIAPAIINAISNATGEEINALPLSHLMIPTKYRMHPTSKSVKKRENKHED
ncbi:molybdopterin-dependent oxidoreductase [Clostridiaceae bacterium 35-E11]